MAQQPLLGLRTGKRAETSHDKGETAENLARLIKGVSLTLHTESTPGAPHFPAVLIDHDNLF
jgi:hypothetical protein